jgi:hypothetical protein
MVTIPRLMFVEAIAFFIASAIHSGALIDASVDPAANVAEGIIGAVLLLAAIVTTVRPSWTRVVGVLAQGFGLLGSLIGLYLAIRGVGPNTVPDVIFHVAIVAMLAIGVVAAFRVPARSPSVAGG